ncbi:MAG: VanZ family protein [Candidatus Cloacimonetes bacterium]|nr:VanZ family protein [Candidatus Cloacimonadota bacterium]
MKKENRKIKLKSRVNFARVNLLLYQFLLVATPFLLVRNYLQQAIGRLSQWSLSLSGLRIPYVMLALILFFVIIAIYNWRRIKLRAFLIFAGVITLMGIGQSFTDYYFNHDFYELQHNWHYFAYGIFAWVSWLYHKEKGNSIIRYLWTTVLMGQLISVFDETAQIFISGRVFDICDIGKDLWGVLVGMIVIVAAESEKLSEYKFRLIHKKPEDNFKNPYSILLILLIYSFFFLSISSILTETRYIVNGLYWTWGIFLIVITSVYLLQFKISRWLVISIIAGLIITAGITIKKNDQNVIIQKRPGLLEWRGIPLPYFDLMIKRNGTVQLVDKKIYFNKKDKINRIYGMTDDILLIGSGSIGQGGKGFYDGNTHFVYNPVTRKPLQILVYPNRQACRIYNQLSSDGKDILFIIHNN